MKKLKPILMVSSALVATPLALAAPLTLNTHLAKPNAFGVTSTLIEGQKEVILVNAHFTNAEALRVAADILDSGKTLKTIFISYGDPDFYFGLDALKKVFPNVDVIATPETVKHISDTRELKLKHWGPQLGANAPASTYIPSTFTAKKLTLEGQEIDIKGQDERTFLWIPSIKAVLGGNLVSSGIHVWTADTPKPADRQKVIEGLQQIKALKPTQVVPGHMAAGAPVGIAAVDFTQNYLKAYEKAVNTTKDSKQLIKSMKKQYPALHEVGTLELGAKVVKGEMQWP